MANFDEAIAKLLPLEGGFVNNPRDPGGATAYGISLKFLRDAKIDINGDNQINLEDVVDLNPTLAKDIYAREWWDKYKYGKIDSQVIANKIFDLSVNCGAHQAHIIVQQSINQIKIINAPWVDADGTLGVNTVGAINKLTRFAKEPYLLQQIKDNAILFYVKLVMNNKSLEPFLFGWLNRAVT